MDRGERRIIEGKEEDDEKSNILTHPVLYTRQGKNLHITDLITLKGIDY